MSISTIKRNKRKRIESDIAEMIIRYSYEEPDRNGVAYSGGIMVSVHGVLYWSIDSALRRVGLSFYEYNDRLNAGMTRQDALEMDPNRYIKERVNLEGKSYRHIGDALNRYGVSRATYEDRKRKGWDKKRAIMEPVIHPKRGISVSVHGKYYSSITQLSKEYGFYSTSVFYYTRKGKTAEEAINILLRNRKSKLDMEKKIVDTYILRV